MFSIYIYTHIYIYRCVVLKPVTCFQYHLNGIRNFMMTVIGFQRVANFLALQSRRCFLLDLLPRAQLFQQHRFPLRLRARPWQLWFVNWLSQKQALGILLRIYIYIYTYVIYGSQTNPVLIHGTYTNNYLYIYMYIYIYI